MGEQFASLFYFHYFAHIAKDLTDFIDFFLRHNQSAQPYIRAIGGSTGNDHTARTAVCKYISLYLRSMKMYKRPYKAEQKQCFMIYLMCKSETHFLPCPFSVASLCIVLVGYKIKYSRNGIILQNSLKITLKKKEGVL